MVYWRRLIRIVQRVEYCAARQQDFHDLGPCVVVLMRRRSACRRGVVYGLTGGFDFRGARVYRGFGAVLNKESLHILKPSFLPSPGASA